MDDTERPIETKTEKHMTYTLMDSLPLPLCIFLGFQHFLMAFVSSPGLPLMLEEPLCMTGDKVATSELVCVNFVVGGIATILQTSLGVRLPIVQGTSVAFLAPTLSILALPRWKCPPIVIPAANITNGVTTATDIIPLLDIATRDPISNQTYVVAGSPEHKELYLTRMREVNGAILVASLLQVFLGFSGLLGLLLRFMGPLSIAPTITLIGLGLAEPAASMSSQYWWIAVLTVVMIVVFSQCMDGVAIPIPGLSIRKCCKSSGTSTAHPHRSQDRPEGGSCCTGTAYRLRLFAMFPVLLSVLVAWLVSFMLTKTDVLPNKADQWGYSARTDINMDVLSKAQWFCWPYPGKIGLPTVSAGAVLGVMAGVLASILESVGDYHACAQLCEAPVPPRHAINRGIGTEGLCCMIGAALGSCNGSTSYSQNIAAIGITKVASRPVVLVCGILLLVFGFVGKVGAVFVTISAPIIGGMFIAMFAMITAVGLSQMRHVDLQKPRNLMVLGMSLFVGLSVAKWVSKNKHSINTGNGVADQTLQVLLSTGMLVGGLTGFVLDNVLPGTREERGMANMGRDRAHFIDDAIRDDVRKDPYNVYNDLALVWHLPGLSRLPFCPPRRVRAHISSENSDDSTRF